MPARKIVVSWVALGNDPFKRDRNGRFVEVDGLRIEGPNLTLLRSSEYTDSVGKMYLFRGASVQEKNVAGETVDELLRRFPNLIVEEFVWDGDDPTDHKGILDFVRPNLTQIRDSHPDETLTIHVSPGTPAMQTIWVLMAETGMIAPPLELVKTIPADRRGDGDPAVETVSLDIETFFRVYTTDVTPEPTSTGVVWDPTRFRSDQLKSLFQEAQRFAQLRVPILILGERGTGKTELAKWVRVAGNPSDPDANWPAVACGQYTEALLASELFGHARGAFTGATKSRDGLLKQADGDTLFLDEIGDLAQPLQRQLIKALEEQRYYPVGADRSVRSRFRLVSATNVPLPTLRKRLDPDFFDRISPLRLTMPPIREIRSELVWMWPAVFERAAQRAAAPKAAARLPVREHDKIVKHLQEHTLPGNFRDLYGVAWRLLAARVPGATSLDIDDAIAYALAGLSEDASVGEGDLPLTRAICTAFGEMAPLDDLLTRYQPLKPTMVTEDLQSFLARESRRIAKTEDSLHATDLVDANERSLRAWAKRKLSFE